MSEFSVARRWACLSLLALTWGCGGGGGDGPKLAPPESRPEDQPVPGGNVPDDWRTKLNR